MNPDPSPQRRVLAHPRIHAHATTPRHASSSRASSPSPTSLRHLPLDEQEEDECASNNNTDDAPLAVVYKQRFHIPLHSRAHIHQHSLTVLTNAYCHTSPIDRQRRRSAQPTVTTRRRSSATTTTTLRPKHRSSSLPTRRRPSSFSSVSSLLPHPGDYTHLRKSSTPLAHENFFTKFALQDSYQREQLRSPKLRSRRPTSSSSSSSEADTKNGRLDETPQQGLPQITGSRDADRGRTESFNGDDEPQSSTRWLQTRPQPVFREESDAALKSHVGGGGTSTDTATVTAAPSFHTIPGSRPLNPSSETKQSSTLVENSETGGSFSSWEDSGDSRGSSSVSSSGTSVESQDQADGCGGAKQKCNFKHAPTLTHTRTLDHAISTSSPPAANSPPPSSLIITAASQFPAPNPGDTARRTPIHPPPPSTPPCLSHGSDNSTISSSITTNSNINKFSFLATHTPLTRPLPDKSSSPPSRMISSSKATSTQQKQNQPPQNRPLYTASSPLRGPPPPLSKDSNGPPVSTNPSPRTSISFPAGATSRLPPARPATPPHTYLSQPPSPSTPYHPSDDTASLATSTTTPTLNATTSPSPSTPTGPTIAPRSPQPLLSPGSADSTPPYADSTQISKSKRAARFANVLLNFKIASDYSNKPPDVRHTTSAGTSALHGRAPAVDTQMIHKPQINERALGPNHLNYQSGMDRVIIASPSQNNINNGFDLSLMGIATNDNIVQKIAAEHTSLPTLGINRDHAGIDTIGFSNDATGNDHSHHHNNIHDLLDNSSQRQTVIHVSPETLMRAQKAKAMFELKYDLVYSFQGSTAWLGQGIDVPRTSRGEPIFIKYNPLQTIRNRKYRPRFNTNSNGFDPGQNTNKNGSNGSNSNHGSISHLYRHIGSSGGGRRHASFSMSTFLWNIDVYELFSDLNWRVIQYGLMRDRFGRHVFPSSYSEQEREDRVTVVKTDPQTGEVVRVSAGQAAEDIALENAISKLSEEFDRRTNSVAVAPPSAAQPSTTVQTHAGIHHHLHHNFLPSSAGSSSKPVLSKIQDKLRQNFSNSGTNGKNDQTDSSTSPLLNDATNTASPHDTPPSSSGSTAVPSSNTALPTVVVTAPATTPIAASALPPQSASPVSASNSPSAVTPTPSRLGSGFSPLTHLRRKSTASNTATISNASGSLTEIADPSNLPAHSQTLPSSLGAANPLTSSPKKAFKLNGASTIPAIPSTHIDTIKQESRRRHSVGMGYSPNGEPIKSTKDVHIESVRQRLHSTLGASASTNNLPINKSSSVVPSLIQPLPPVLLVNDKKVSPDTSYDMSTASATADPFASRSKVPDINVSEVSSDNGTEGSNSNSSSNGMRNQGGSSSTNSSTLSTVTPYVNSTGVGTGARHGTADSKGDNRRRHAAGSLMSKRQLEVNRERILEMYASELEFLELVFLLRYNSVNQVITTFDGNPGGATATSGIANGSSDTSDTWTSASESANASSATGSTLLANSINGSASTASMANITPNGKTIPSPIKKANLASAGTPTRVSVAAAKTERGTLTGKLPGSVASGFMTPAAAAAAAAAAANNPNAAAPRIKTAADMAICPGREMMLPAAVQEYEVKRLSGAISATTSRACKEAVPRVRSALSELETQLSTARRTRISTTSTRLDNLLVHSDQTLNKLSTTLTLEVKKVSERMDNLERSYGPGSLLGLLSIFDRTSLCLLSRDDDSHHHHHHRHHGGGRGKSFGIGGGRGSGSSGSGSGGKNGAGGGGDNDDDDDDDEDGIGSGALRRFGRTASFRVFSGGRGRVSAPGMVSRFGYTVLEYTLVTLMWIIWIVVAILLRFKTLALCIWKLVRLVFFWM